MMQLLTSILLASLLAPAVFSFFDRQPIGRSYGTVSAERPAAPERIADDSLGIKTTARAVLVADNASGAVLYAKHDQASQPIASITKLMTALVFLDHNPGWETKVTVTAADQRDGGIVYLNQGETVTVRDLFHLMLVASANEAAAALARSTGLENFVAAMNQKAAELGMNQSQFTDETGLSAGNIASPRDLVTLAGAAFSQPDLARAVTTSQYLFTVGSSGRRRLAVSTDQLLQSFINTGPYRITGAKTGHLDEAGYTLVVTVQKDNGPTVTLVLLGAASQPDRWQEAKGLVDWVFGHYRWPDES